MKKITIIFMMLSLLFTGCQSSGHDTVSTTDPAETTSALADPVTYEPTTDPAETTSALADPVTYEPTTDPAEMTSALADPVTYEPDDFEISARVIDGTFARGETILINVSITNKMDVAYTWTGSSSAIYARTKFVCTENGRKFIIPDNERDLNDDDNYNEFKPGETETNMHWYEIPDDAAPGEYTLVCSFKNTTFEMKDGFILE